MLAIIRAAAERPERWEVPDGTLPALVVGSLLFATLWRRFVGAGPLEAALRALTRLVTRDAARPRVKP